MPAFPENSFLPQGSKAPRYQMYSHPSILPVRAAFPVLPDNIREENAVCYAGFYHQISTLKHLCAALPRFCNFIYIPDRVARAIKHKFSSCRPHYRQPFCRWAHSTRIYCWFISINIAIITARVFFYTLCNFNKQKVLKHTEQKWPNLRHKLQTLFYICASTTCYKDVSSWPLSLPLSSVFPPQLINTC